MTLRLGITDFHRCRMTFACKGKPSKHFESSIWHIDLAANLGARLDGGFSEMFRGEDLVKRIVVRGKYKNMLAGVGRFASSWLKFLQFMWDFFNDNGYESDVLSHMYC